MKPRFESDWRRTKEEGVKVKTNHTRVRMSHIRTHAILTDARINTHTDRGHEGGAKVLVCVSAPVCQVCPSRPVHRQRPHHIFAARVQARIYAPSRGVARRTDRRERGRKKSAADDEQKPPSR